MAHYRVSIVQYPSNRYGFVGSLPEPLTRLSTNGIGQVVRVSRSFGTEAEAQQFLADYYQTLPFNAHLQEASNG